MLPDEFRPRVLGSLCWLAVLFFCLSTLSSPATTLGDLDYPDRPKASPSSGFMIQSRAGKQGNFEVVIPWPDGGLAAFARDNDDKATFPWHGPIFFGDGRYTGASLIESGFTTVKAGKDDMKNFEVIAISALGAVEHWSRENGRNFAWKRVSVLGGDGVGTPALVYTGANFMRGALDINLESHGDNSFFMAYAKRDGGFEYWQFVNAVLENNWEYKKPTWFQITGKGPEGTKLRRTDDNHYTGVGIALTTLSSGATFDLDWKGLYSAHGLGGTGRSPLNGGGGQLVAAVSRDGGLVVFKGATGWKQPYGATHGVPDQQVWSESVVLGAPGPNKTTDLHAFRGNACLFQGDFGLTDNIVTINLALQPKHFGNLELMVPAKTGGIFHMARDNGNTNHDSKPLTEGWGSPERIGTGVYDEVSCLESNFGGGFSGNMQMIARAHDQKGFDFFWRGDDGKWRGPQSVGLPSPNGVGHVPGSPDLGVIRQPLGTDSPSAGPRPMGSPAEIISSLAAANIEFSHPEAPGQLRAWMADPIHTPYPAISKVLLTLLGPQRLLKPAFIDVIAYKYEPNQNATRPRKEAEVDAARLKAAVVAASNERNGTRETDFARLLTH